MSSKTYPELIDTALKIMDSGNYNESIILLKEIIKSEKFLKLTLKTNVLNCIE